MLDILFVHPNSSKVIYQDLAKKNSALEPPIWCAMLANSLRNFGSSVSIIDAEVNNLTYEEVSEDICKINPKIVCIVVYGQQPSASSHNMYGAVTTAEKIKSINKNQFIVFVGGHVSALPVETLKKESSIDAVCSNEGVYSLKDLAQLEKFEDNYLIKVKGLVLGIDGFIKINDPSIVVQKYVNSAFAWNGMDLLPPLQNYRTAGWHSGLTIQKETFAALYTSLGCLINAHFV